MRKSIISFIILFFIWLGIGFVASRLQPLSLFSILLGTIFLIFTLILLFKAFSLLVGLCAFIIFGMNVLFQEIVDKIDKFIFPKKNHQQPKIREQLHSTENVEQITLDHPEYIGLLTKIDKKRIAEEYLAEQKKRRKYAKKRT